MITTFVWFCNKEEKGCGLVFEASCERFEVSEFKPKCPNCKSKKRVYRDYRSEDINSFGPTKTVGSRMDKNNAKLSDDFVIHKRNQKLGIKDE